MTGLFRNHCSVFRWVRVIQALLLLVPFGTAVCWGATAQVEMLQPSTECPAGGAYPLRFRVRVSPLWYIHGPHSNHDGLVPSRLSFEESPLVRVTDIQFPAPEKKQFPYAKDPVEVLSGEFEVTARILLDPTIGEGPHEIPGAFSYQACSAISCLPPESVPVRISITVVPPGQTGKAGKISQVAQSDRIPSARPPEAEAEGQGGLWLTLIGFFLGGLALNLTPCVYPLIPITVSYFGGRGRRSWKAALAQGVIYIGGLSVTNSILGVTAGLSGAMLGSVLQNPIVLTTVAGILVALALSFFGLWEIRLPSALTRVASRSYGGYFGAFFMGLTLGIVAAPCLGPFILGLLTWVGQKGDPFLGFASFFVLSTGMGLPLAVLALFSGALRRLPLSGSWMEWIRKVLGWVLVGMAGYLLQPLIPDPKSRWTLLSIIAAAAGLHLGWLDRSRLGSPVFSKVKQGAGIGLIVGALALFFFGGPRHGEGVQWVPYSEGILKEAALANRPVILDFYAEWCGPCKAMETEIFTAEEVVQFSKRFLPVRMDLTRRHPDQEEILRRYQVRGVPTILFLNREGKEETDLRIESYVGKDEVLKRMKRAAGPTP